MYSFRISAMFEAWMFCGTFALEESYDQFQKPHASMTCCDPWCLLLLIASNWTIPRESINWFWTSGSESGDWTAVKWESHSCLIILPSSSSTSDSRGSLGGWFQACDGFDDDSQVSEPASISHLTQFHPINGWFKTKTHFKKTHKTNQ